MADFLSFEALLRKYLRRIRPRLILEWGPGNSTRIMLEETPKAIIHTIEHDKSWFEKWRRGFKSHRNVHIYHIPLTEAYHLTPLKWREKGLFDLAFIDGRRRVLCLQVAREMLRPEGLVILHDSERERYNPGKALYHIIEEREGTAVLGR